MYTVDVLGNVPSFYLTLCDDLSRINIGVAHLPFSHICYRTSSIDNYDSMKEHLRKSSRAMVEQDFRGRPLSMFLLRTPLILSPSHLLELIELPAPHTSQGEHDYPDGLEHAGFVVGPRLSAFKERHKNVLSGHKERGSHCQFSYVTFPSGVSAKFYNRPLTEVLSLTGWEFSPL